MTRDLFEVGDTQEQNEARLNKDITQLRLEGPNRPIGGID